MGLDAIVQEIKAKGKAEAERISGEAYKEASLIIAEAQSQAEKIKAAKEMEARREIERIRQQEISSANLEVKRSLLNARKEVLDEVAEKTKSSVLKLPAEKNQKLMQSIIRKYEADNSKIYSNGKDKVFVKKITKLEYAGEIDIMGGVVIENEDGTESLDFKYDTILKEVSEQSLKQVSDILFG
ncbi:MAG: V-type ATP synthase subunit E [Candidatus Methanoperedens sp.]|nr:V-type ATP synthase subunit E [Candidatus Methanoperedens sp.]MCZ7370847.1 V-type ATP synthase subunit E [Candidatus Methanoperedens sp.]